jgi:hypothetical protein
MQRCDSVEDRKGVARTLLRQSHHAKERVLGKSIFLIVMGVAEVAEKAVKIRHGKSKGLAHGVKSNKKC